jgi:tetratricopeptide (TPR) repeat protein
VRVHLPAKHVFRARVMVRLGYVLASMGKHQEALIPGRDGAEMLRELVTSDFNTDTSYFFSIALYNLARRYTNLDQNQNAIAADQEVFPRLRELANTRTDSRELLAFTLIYLSRLLTQQNNDQEAMALLEEALPILRDTANKKQAFQPEVTETQPESDQRWCDGERLREQQELNARGRSETHSR